MPSKLFYLNSGQIHFQVKGFLISFAITIFYRNSYINEKQCNLWFGSTLFAYVPFMER